MVKLTDLPEYERNHLLSKNGRPLGPAAWTDRKKPVSDLRVALITTAGIHTRDSDTFYFTDASYRPISKDQKASDIVMSHSSVNFDKSGFVEDINVVFPLDRIRELAKNKKLGSVADIHYSFMGAGLEPEAFEKTALQVAGLLKQDQVDAVLLTPV